MCGVGLFLRVWVDGVGVGVGVGEASWWCVGESVGVYRWWIGVREW